MLTTSDFNRLWFETVHSLLAMGKFVSPRGTPTYEFNGWSMRLDDIANNWVWVPGRKLKASYGAAELLWYLSGSDDGRVMQRYAPQYSNFLDGLVAYGAYGARWQRYDQLRRLVKTLQDDQSSRRAVVTCWEPDDLAREKRDIPCTLSLQFLQREGHLNLITTMRSNDAWLGLPYDVWCFSTLQKLVADSLDLRYGWYQHQVGSLHLYERDAKKLGRLTTVGPTRLPRVHVPYRDVDNAVNYAVVMEKWARESGTEPKYQHLPGSHVLTECVALCAVYCGLSKPSWLDPRLIV